MKLSTSKAWAIFLPADCCKQRISPRIGQCALSATILSLLLGCGGSKSDPLATRVDEPMAVPSSSSRIHVDPSQPESLLGRYRVVLDQATLSAVVTFDGPQARHPQANDALYALTLAPFFRHDSFRIVGLGVTATDIRVQYEVEHPIAPPTGPPWIASGMNRADLGISGRVMFGFDVATATDNTYFDETATGGGRVVANTAAVLNADGFYKPAGLITQTTVANTFPYLMLVDETGAGSRVGVSNGNTVTGNFGSNGWTRTKLGAAPPYTGWTGFGYLHQGQVSRRELRLNLAALSGITSLAFDAIVIAQYQDPRGGTTTAELRANRLPVSPPDATKFAYRMPHGTLDIPRVEFCLQSEPYKPGQVSSAALSFLVTDWDARALETTQAALHLDSDVTKVAQGESGLPQFAVCIPQVLGGANVIDAWNPATTVEDDDRACGGDIGQDSGRPGDALYYRKTVTSAAIPDLRGGFYTGMARVIDPVGSNPVTPLDPAQLPAAIPLTSNRPAPTTYQAFAVQVGEPNFPPTCSCAAVTSPITSGDGLLQIQVTEFSDPEDDAVSIQFDWNNDGDYLDAGEGLLALNSAGPNVFSSPITYSNSGLTTQNRSVGLNCTDLINNPGTVASVTFAVGPNQAPKLVSGSYTIQGAAPSGVPAIYAPSPAAFRLIEVGELVVEDPEGDTLVLTAVATPDAGTTQLKTAGNFPIQLDPFYNGPTKRVTFEVWAHDALRPYSSGVLIPEVPESLEAEITLPHSWGSIGHDAAYGVAVDSSYRIITAGRISAAADLDPTTGTYSRTPVGTSAGFITRINGDGSFDTAWLIDAPPASAGSCSIYEIKLDSNDNMLMCGVFSGTIDADPGSGTKLLTSTAGTVDAFAIKLSPTGEHLWSGSWGGAGTVVASKLALATNGDPVVVGHFAVPALGMDCDPGPGTVPPPVNNMGSDGYAIRLSAGGTAGQAQLLWHAYLQGTGTDRVSAVAVAADGSAFLGGVYQGQNTDFNPSGATQHRDTVQPAPFIWKLGSNGQYIESYAYNFTTAQPADSGEVTALLLDDVNARLYVSGWFTSTFDFRLGTGTVDGESRGGADGFLFALRPTIRPGVMADWVTDFGLMTWGASGDDAPADLVLTPNGPVMAGFLAGSSGLGFPCFSSYSSAGAQDIQVQAFTNNGACRWSFKLGGTGADYGWALAHSAPTGQEWLYLVGEFASSGMDFDPAPGSAAPHSPVGDADTFMIRLNPTGGTL